jgi:hypothetical protein
MTQIEDPFTFGYYGQSSRCFNIEMDENRAPVCYKAECKNGVVYINIGNKTLACNKPGNDRIMQINGWKWIIGRYNAQEICNRFVQFPFAITIAKVKECV